MESLLLIVLAELTMGSGSKSNFDVDDNIEDAHNQIQQGLNMQSPATAENKKVAFLFGETGNGKTFVAKKLEEDFGWTRIEGDDYFQQVHPFDKQDFQRSVLKDLVVKREGQKFNEWSNKVPENFQNRQPFWNRIIQQILFALFQKTPFQEFSKNKVVVTQAIYFREDRHYVHFMVTKWGPANLEKVQSGKGNFPEFETFQEFNEWKNQLHLKAAHKVRFSYIWIKTTVEKALERINSRKKEAGAGLDKEVTKEMYLEWRAAFETPERDDTEFETIEIQNDIYQPSLLRAVTNSAPEGGARNRRAL